MFQRCQTSFCILILMCMVCTYSSTPLGHRGAMTFSNSLRLTRTIRVHVQQLLSQYKQQVFSGEFFECDLKLSTLPSVTVSYQTWLHMQDTERLRLASNYLQTFWTHLERQRQQFEREGDATKERREQRRDKRGRPQPTLSQSFVELQIDLRDLMRQVNSQLRRMTSPASTKSPLLHLLHSTSASMHHSTDSSKKLQTSSPSNNLHTSAHSTVHSSQTLNSADRGLISKTEKTTVILPQPTRASTVETPGTTTAGASLWIQHLRGYVILRDLERYLSRLARDYTVLQTKY